MSDIAIVTGRRTPHGRFLGSLASVGAVELGKATLRGVLDETELESNAIDWVALGNAISAGIGQVPARQAVVESGLPNHVPATTINEASGSGLRAITLGVDRITAGRADFVIAGGMESMSNAPYLVEDMRRGRRYGDGALVDSMIRDSLWDMSYDAHMGELTEELVERFDISRREQDEYAAESHQRASQSIADGAFADEIVPVPTAEGQFSTDEGPRSDTDVDALGGLEPVFKTDGTITAGNASDLSDGAGCILLGDSDAVTDAGLEPLANVIDYAVTYRDPKWFGRAVGDAVEQLLDSNDLSVSDIDVFELNEAFAAQMVYVREQLEIPHEKLNPRGGAIALGHPIGASGGILSTALVHTLRDRDASLGVVGMSIGGGGGIAVLIRAT